VPTIPRREDRAEKWPVLGRIYIRGVSETGSAFVVEHRSTSDNVIGSDAPTAALRFTSAPSSAEGAAESRRKAYPGRDR
jgi:hypothetical protein